MVYLNKGLGLPLLLLFGLILGEVSRVCRILKLRMRAGSNTKLGIPVADVVVVHVLERRRTSSGFV